MKIFAMRLNNKILFQIKAEVVCINNVVDFILLEALEGKTFFDGDKKENILEDPVIGKK